MFINCSDLSLCACVCAHLCINASDGIYPPCVRARACVCEGEALNILPNIIMPYQGHFPLSGLALPAGIDWEKIRAYSLAYKKSCKQSHIVATGGGALRPGSWPLG